MQASQLNFTSRIRLLSSREFDKEVATYSCKQFVDHPWTAKEIIKAPKVHTIGIQDCTAGFISDGTDAVMFHICPTIPQNHDFKKIEHNILEKLSSKMSDLQGFLIGGNHFIDYSMEQFDKFERFFKNKLSIPYTKLQEHGFASDSSIYYNSTKDEIGLCNNFIDKYYGHKTSEELLRKSYYDFKISDLDEIV